VALAVALEKSEFNSPVFANRNRRAWPSELVVFKRKLGFLEFFQ
jgi:hypothetical protein